MFRSSCRARSPLLFLPLEIQRMVRWRSQFEQQARTQFGIAAQSRLTENAVWRACFSGTTISRLKLQSTL